MSVHVVEGSIMSQVEDGGRLHRQTVGACHRCGWRGPLSKVTRQDRKRLALGRTYGRICRDCALDLSISAISDDTSVRTGTATLKAVHDRDVA
jgi:hypothetical protein